MTALTLGLSLLSFAIWVGLLTLRGQFWRADQQLEDTTAKLERWPRVCAVIPARNEADVLPISLRSLLLQDYPGVLSVVVVDDRSTDGTAEVARKVADQIGKDRRVDAILGKPLPSGWSGKVWAMEQGVRQAQDCNPDCILLTDADIEHDPANVRQLVLKLVSDRLEMASLMVRLRCQSGWERLLIPAFVFFFQKLYPFRWVNDPRRRMAGAAGGCILVRNRALLRIGGFESFREALIDDCALAAAVKVSKQGETYPIWLGLSSSTRSLRPYPDLASVWHMVARTAFTQLHYSVWQLLGTVVGMGVIYVVPPVGTLWGFSGAWPLAIAAGTAWLLMALAYWPTLKFYRQPLLFAFCLPAIAGLYTLMTLDSARRHWQGKGGAWKGRVYSSE
jgi:hopene-associated glycosyltransferase HpnB